MKMIVKWCSDQFRYHVVFHKSILFILGLLFSFRLMENLFFSILISYLIPSSTAYDLRLVAIVVNLQGGICSVLTIFLAVVADAYVGLFNMLLFASTLCISGLVLIHQAATKKDDIAHPNMFYSALVVLTLSEAATIFTFNAFLKDELEAIDLPTTPLQDIKTEDRIKFWFLIVSIFASVFSLFGPLKKDMRLTMLARNLAIIMGAAVFFFLLGSKFYAHLKPSYTTLRDVPAVICNAIIKRRLAYPQTSDQLHQNFSTDSLQIPPHISWLRWLDKAAVVEENRSGRISSVEQVKGVKFLVKMLPMWSTFITFSLVFASGDTFFLEEAFTLTDEIFPILLLITAQTYTAKIVSGISSCILQNLIEKKKFNPQKMMLVRIGMGMVCCVLCCVAAWSQAVHRLHLMETYGYDADASEHMSVYRLTPQFMLLAFMEGLSLSGLEEFFHFEVCRSISRYKQLFGECVVGFGRFVSVVCILVFTHYLKWFGSEVETSRLDKYYVVLAVVSCANIVVYCFVARWYGHNKSVEGNAVMCFATPTDTPLQNWSRPGPPNEATVKEENFLSYFCN